MSSSNIIQSMASCTVLFFFQAEHGIRDLVRSRGLGDVYKRQNLKNYPGITGNITIDANRNANKSAVVLEIKNGKFTYSTTVAP